MSLTDRCSITMSKGPRQRYSLLMEYGFLYLQNTTERHCGVRAKFPGHSWQFYDCESACERTVDVSGEGPPSWLVPLATVQQNPNTPAPMFQSLTYSGDYN